jgi:hypothetical protein
MTYDASEARSALADELLDAAAEVATAIAYASAAYELLDETSGDRLEERVFGPLQKALGGLRRAVGGFAARYGDDAADPGSPPPDPHPSQGVAALLEGCATAARTADDLLGTLQDSFVLVELGDAELRAGVSEARRRLAEVPPALRAFGRTLGR